MPDEIKPNGETPEKPVPAAPVPVVTPAPSTIPAAVSADTTVTNEVFDQERAMATIKAQREKEKELKAQLKDYERLKADEQKRVEAQMTEAEKLNKQVAELTARNAEMALGILRRDVVSEIGLPAIFVDRLKGNTREEMLADAQELLKTIPQNQSAPRLKVTQPGNSQTVETKEQQRERLFGRQGNVFGDINAIREAGGGVVWTKPPET